MQACPPLAMSVVGVGASGTRLSMSIPVYCHSKALLVWTQLTKCQLLELTSASSLLYRLSRLKQLCQYDCLSKRAFVSKVLSGEELLFSQSLILQLCCYIMLADLCLLNLGVSTCNLNNPFKYCFLKTVTS